MRKLLLAALVFAVTVAGVASPSFANGPGVRTANVGGSVGRGVARIGRVPLLRGVPFTYPSRPRSVLYVRHCPGCSWYTIGASQCPPGMDCFWGRPRRNR